MRKPKSTWDCKAYYDFLFNRVPHWENEILKSWADERSPIPIDVRLLPNAFRPVYRLIHFQRFSISKASKTLHRKPWTVRRQYKKANDLINKLLISWLDKLPRKLRKKEWKKREPDAWIGKVETGPWEAFTSHHAVRDRLHIGAPDLSDGWNLFDTSTSNA